MALSVQNCKKPTVGTTLPSACSSPALSCCGWAALPGRPGGIANGYSALLYSLPVIEAILMPVMMAVLASRLWDMEIKGSTAKLLYTLQKPPQPVCRQSGLWNRRRSVGHGAGAGLRSVLGRIHGYTEAFPTGQLVYLSVCTLAVDAMLL